MDKMTTINNKISADVNHFPSITWHHLHINHGHFECELDSVIDFDVSTGSKFIEVSKVPIDKCPVPVEIKTQIGEDFESALDEFERYAKNDINFIHIKAGNGDSSFAKIVYSPDSQKNQYSETVVYAEENSKASLVFEYSSSGEGEGLFGHRIKIYCAPYAELDVTTVNLLSKNIQHYNGIGVLQEENSLFSLNQIDLGARDIVNGSSITLQGTKAKSTVRCGYLVGGAQNIDMNYVVRHQAKDTASSCFYNGVVDGNAKKAWRGTIDFKEGCKESVGDEQENVLLLSPDVVNKSMPVILCGEEDVDGRHGSSIGKINEDELLYLETRGIDKAEARALMIRSKVNAIARFIPDEQLKDKISVFLEDNL